VVPETLSMVVLQWTAELGLWKDTEMRLSSIWGTGVGQEGVGQNFRPDERKRCQNRGGRETVQAGGGDTDRVRGGDQGLGD